MKHLKSNQICLQMKLIITNILTGTTTLCCFKRLMFSPWCSDQIVSGHLAPVMQHTWSQTLKQVLFNTASVALRRVAVSSYIHACWVLSHRNQLAKPVTSRVTEPVKPTHIRVTSMKACSCISRKPDYLLYLPDYIVTFFVFFNPLNVPGKLGNCCVWRLYLSKPLSWLIMYLMLNQW